MFERFTDHAREVMKQALAEAHGFNHEYIGTEHELLALVKHGPCTATALFEKLGVSVERIQREIEALLTPGPTIAKKRRRFFRWWVPSDRLPQTPRAKKVVEYSLEEARNLRHNYIGTEHLLLGLLREQEGIAAQALTKLSLELNAVRQELVRLLEEGRE